MNIPFDTRYSPDLIFTDALKYLKETSAKNIAKRTAIYGAYFNFLGKNFGHDIILDVVAAICGPFSFESAKDEMVLDFLDYIEYGFNPNWTKLAQEWITNYGFANPHDIVRETNAFAEMFNYLIKSGKGDEIYKEFGYICQVIQPTLYDYFPEFDISVSAYDNPNRWERI